MSDLDGVAGQGGEGLRSTGLSGCPKIPNLFRSFGIGILNLFVIWCLGFGIL